MKVQALDGDVFEGSPKDIVIQMHDSSMAPATSDKAWMQQTAERAKMQTGGALVRTDTPDNFIADLIKNGMLKEVE
jgi:hypothetical protein